MIEWLGHVGAQLIIVAIRIAYLAVLAKAAVFAHDWAMARMSPLAAKITAAVAAILAVLAVASLFEPTAHVLQSYTCGKSDDYEYCMEGGTSIDPM